MPVTLLDRLPLPNLKVYTAASVMMLSVAVYHAVNVTSEPGWRVNSTQAAGEGSAEAVEPSPLLVNNTRNMTEQLADAMTYMMQEPLCMWTMINMAYCSLGVVGVGIQRAVFGPLRVAEAQRVKDKFWNYVFYKFIFVFGVLNVQYMDEVLVWCSWFTLVGFLHLLTNLAKDRFEYLLSSLRGGLAATGRVSVLAGGVCAASALLLAAAARTALPHSRDTFAFMAAECILVMTGALHVCARWALQARDADAYYTHLAFDSLSLVVEALHVLHMVVYSRLVVSMPSLVLLMQLRHLLHDLHARLRTHRRYCALARHMTTNYPMASKEEVEKNQDNCAICWEPMKEARKLPCAHLFHNSCLCQWVQQDASCPTCRRALLALQPAPAPPAPPPRRNLFRFDGSRYVSWLPSFSVEVTRVAAPPPDPARLDAMLAQVSAMFPQYPRAWLAREVARSRSADAAIDNILEGRLLAPPPEMLEEAPAEPPAASVAHAATSTSELTATVLRAPPHHHNTTTSTSASLREAAPAPVRSKFSSESTERECALARRKQELIDSARQRYLDKVAARAAAVRGAEHAAGVERS